MKKYVASLKHRDDKRAHIPSGEEAGYEADNRVVRDEPPTRAFPRNPVVTRGQDPELFWMNKYGPDDNGTPTTVDIRSLYRHEHIAPEQLLKGLYRVVADESSKQGELFSVNELFGNALEHDELEKISDYYTHSDGWSNRMILGDSLLVMNSLLEREGMAGQVQCIYIDPPYGIKYGSNWQIKLNNRTVTDGQDDSLSGEPEQIRSCRREFSPPRRQPRQSNPRPIAPQPPPTPYTPCSPLCAMSGLYKVRTWRHRRGLGVMEDFEAAVWFRDLGAGTPQRLCRGGLRQGVAGSCSATHGRKRKRAARSLPPDH